MPQKDIEVIDKKLYSKVKANTTPTVIANFKKMMGVFIDQRRLQLYDIAPCDRIIFTEEDGNKLFTILGIDKEYVTNDVLSNVYYAEIKDFNPRAAKDPLTILALCWVRYMILVNKDEKNIELALMYLSFSGKFYPSIHSGSYPVVQPSEYRHVMEYVVNTQLSQKFDIKKHGSVVKSVISIGLTWIETYKDRIKDFDDEDVVYLVQQLHGRIKSFMQNIAEKYYEAYSNKNLFMSYDSDNLDEDSYRLVDNDSLLLERYVEKTMTYITSSSVDYSRCRTSANGTIRTDELKSILEIILVEQGNIPKVRSLVTSLLTEYFLNSTDKDPTNPAFIASSISVKPNSKNINVENQKAIIESFLDENSAAYRKRKHRLATRSAYHKAVLNYFVLTINAAAKN